MSPKTRISTLVGGVGLASILAGASLSNINCSNNYSVPNTPEIVGNVRYKKEACDGNIRIYEGTILTDKGPVEGTLFESKAEDGDWLIWLDGQEYWRKNTRMLRNDKIEEYSVNGTSESNELYRKLKKIAQDEDEMKKAKLIKKRVKRFKRTYKK